MFDLLTSRVIVISIFALLFIIIFLSLAFSLWRINPYHRVNHFFIIFFICTSIIGVIQILYLFFLIPFVIIILNKIGIIILNFASIFLLLGVFIFHFGNKKLFQDKKIILMTITLIILNFGLYCIPNGVSITIDYEPHWSILFGTYQFIFSQSIYLLQLLISLKVFNETTGIVRQKFKFFIIGITLLDIFYIWAIIYNLHILIIISSFGLIFQISGIVGAFLIYYGIKGK
ncbi:MAG: hypothetical protein ACTSXT_06495 [Candidatus Helarchaeota archaeon]